MDGPPIGTGLGKIARFIRRHYAPFLLRPVVKGVVVLIFAGVFVASVISMQHLQLGLGKSILLLIDAIIDISHVPQTRDWLYRRIHTLSLISTTSLLTWTWVHQFTSFLTKSMLPSGMGSRLHVDVLPHVMIFLLPMSWKLNARDQNRPSYPNQALRG